MRNYLRGHRRATPVEDDALFGRINAISARSRLEARDYPQVEVAPTMLDVRRRFWTPEEVATRSNDCEAPE